MHRNNLFWLTHQEKIRFSQAKILSLCLLVLPIILCLSMRSSSYAQSDTGSLSKELTAESQRQVTQPEPNPLDTLRRPVGTLIIRLEGGNVSANAAQVLTILSDLNMLKLVSHMVKLGENLCSIYEEKSHFPGGCSLEMIDFANKLNKTDYKSRSLRIGEEILYPQMEFQRYPFSFRLYPEISKDRNLLENIRKYWRHLILSEEEESGGAVRLKLQGYELRVPITALQAVSVMEVLSYIPTNTKNILVGFVSQTEPKKQYYSKEQPHRFWDQCRAGKSEMNEQGALGYLLGMSELLPCDSEAPCKGNTCPEIVLIDTPVHPHPDLEGAIKYTESKEKPLERSSINTKEQICQDISEEWNNEDHHGTHLAGIIASQDNGYGFIGIHPGAQIYSLNWRREEYEITDEIDRCEARTARQIYVFASSWSSESLADKLIGLKIKRESLLWITAAGQVNRKNEPQGVPINITENTDLGPMNLGNWKNVIVVTACSDCGPVTARLMEDAYYSDRGFVHLAAPGKDIPSTATATRYAKASGTSQATAFVAGVISAMHSCYRDYYKTPWRIKERIQYTAKPVFTSDDAKKVASGIVDPTRALLNPEKSYLQTIGQVMVPIEIEGWCLNTIELLHVHTGNVLQNGSIRTRDIYRIVEVKQENQNEPRKWVIYTRVPWDHGKDHIGEVLRVGPGTLGPVRVSPESRYKDLDKPLIKTNRGIKRLGNIEDLLVHPNITVVSCN